MQLILADVRLKLGKFVNLMTQRLRVVSAKGRPTTPALARFARHDLITIFAGKERTFLLGVTRLSAAFPF